MSLILNCGKCGGRITPSMPAKAVGDVFMGECCYKSLITPTKSEPINGLEHVLKNQLLLFNDNQTIHLVHRIAKPADLANVYFVKQFDKRMALDEVSGFVGTRIIPSTKRIVYTAEVIGWYDEDLNCALKSLAAYHSLSYILHT